MVTRVACKRVEQALVDVSILACEVAKLIDHLRAEDLFIDETELLQHACNDADLGKTERYDAVSFNEA